MSDKATPLHPKLGAFAKACVGVRLHLQELAERAPEHLAIAAPHDLGVIASTILRMNADMDKLAGALNKHSRESDRDFVGDGRTVVSVPAHPGGRRRKK